MGKKALELLTDDNPYTLDRIEGQENMPALTGKNARFIEAVVRLDSNYAKDFLKEQAPEEGFDPEIEADNAQGRCGSTAFWFDQMTAGHYSFETCVLGAVIAIDSTNSTHTGATEGGREAIRGIIVNDCPNLEALKDALRKPFEPSKKHLLSLLSSPLKAKNKTSTRCNLSFASKFCSYAAYFLGLKEEGVEYSKYDSVVSKRLPQYLEAYGLRDHVSPREFVCTGKSFEKKMEVYKKYSDAIGELIKEVDVPEINRDTLDHIIWYAFK